MTLSLLPQNLRHAFLLPVIMSAHLLYPRCPLTEAYLAQTVAETNHHILSHLLLHVLSLLLKTAVFFEQLRMLAPMHIAHPFHETCRSQCLYFVRYQHCAFRIVFLHCQAPANISHPSLEARAQAPEAALLNLSRQRLIHRLAPLQPFFFQPPESFFQASLHCDVRVVLPYREEAIQAFVLHALDHAVRGCKTRLKSPFLVQ
mmetsp:Transcript_101777/g.160919  ORF Transcript_101777/g.160919 Transcript_101777/m.160919 type:complete len:202 (-) Transcript_101777:1836-2441(-)